MYLEITSELPTYKSVVDQDKIPHFLRGLLTKLQEGLYTCLHVHGGGGVVRSDPFGGDHPWSQTPLVRTSSGGHQSGRTGMHTYFPHKNDITFIPPAIPSTVALNTCGSKGQQRRAPPLRLNSFIFKQFSAKMLQNNRLVQLL